MSLLKTPRPAESERPRGGFAEKIIAENRQGRALSILCIPFAYGDYIVRPWPSSAP